jgi:hypothetical protein
LNSKLRCEVKYELKLLNQSEFHPILEKKRRNRTEPGFSSRLMAPFSMLTHKYIIR